MVRLLAAEPKGLSVAGMAQISRLDPVAVEAALAELETLGDAATTTIVFKGAPLTIWRRR